MNEGSSKHKALSFAPLYRSVMLLYLSVSIGINFPLLNGAALHDFGGDDDISRARVRTAIMFASAIPVVGTAVALIISGCGATGYTFQWKDHSGN